MKNLHLTDDEKVLRINFVKSLTEVCNHFGIKLKISKTERCYLGATPGRVSFGNDIDTLVWIDE